VSGAHSLNLLALTFAMGAVVGLGLLAGASAVSPVSIAMLLDLHRDGIDMKDALAFARLFGHAPILIRHVLPGIARV
jgi:hypothetical protein